MRGETYTYKRKCPFDDKPCEIRFYDDLQIDRTCRYESWNNNIENPKCGLSLDRKKKSAKPKSKRKSKKKGCGCK